MLLMPSRISALAAVLFCGAVFASAHSSDEGVARDWSKYPAVLRVTTSADIYAVGDVHGDYDRLVGLLAVNHLIAAAPSQPDHPQWTAGHSVLVCTGDLIDRWTNGIAVIRFFRALQLQARAAGGEVVVTMGNHEAGFLDVGGDHGRTETFEQELKSAGIHPNAVRRGTDPDGLGQFLRNLPIMAVVNDWCFVHAGNFQGRSLPQLQRDLEEGISRHGFGAAILSAPDSILEARARPYPWWETGLAKLSDAEQHLRQQVSALGCQHLVTGHQPKEVRFANGAWRPAGEVWSAFHGLLFLIDTGMSRGIGLSNGALLWIQTSKGTAAVLSADGKTHQMWP